MYDDNKLRTSETYFTVLQLLRVFKDWATEPEDNIRLLANHLRLELGREETQVPEAEAMIDANWAMLLAHAHSLAEDITGRIERKINEVESLRDGVSRSINHFVRILHKILT